MWRLMAAPEQFWAVEQGAGSGRLAADIVGYLAASDPDFTEAFHYLAVDIVPPMQPLPEAVQWLRASGLPIRRFQGCVLANELLDAMPVHRVTVQQGKVREIYVALDERGAPTEVVGEPSTPKLAQRLAALGVDLPEGYRTEICLAIEPWLRRVSQVMERGYLLIIDYGHEASVLYDEQRKRGTLRCYHRHTLNANPYQHVGDQDISVHVDFTSVRQIAESLGMTLVGYATQAEFLANLGLDPFRQDIAVHPGLAPSVRRSNLMALDTLVDPEGMGRFKVLVMGKDVPAVPLWGFMPSADGGHRPGRLVPGAAPLATPEHMPPHLEEPALPTWRELLR
jgi:SAM-dependent MidA family methyltransferase